MLCGADIGHLTQPSGPVSFINAQTLLAEDSGDEDPPRGTLAIVRRDRCELMRNCPRSDHIVLVYDIQYHTIVAVEHRPYGKKKADMMGPRFRARGGNAEEQQARAAPQHRLQPPAARARSIPQERGVAVRADTGTSQS